MRYLFGDSSDSPLDINYLSFLRDAIEFGVAVLQADAGLTSSREQRATRQLAAAESIEAIEELGRLASVPTNAAAGDDPVLERTAAAIAQAIGEVVKRDAGRIRAGLTTELEQLDAEAQRLRERCRSALGTLLATNDLPGAVETLSVRWNGAMHEARLQQKVGFGVEAMVSLDIPPGSLFAQDLKVERFADSAEIHAPETAGWLKKEVKMVPHKLGRHHVTHVIVAKSGVTMRLRATPDAGAIGFDITVPRAGDPKVERVGGKEADSSFATDERDLAGLRALAAKLEAAVEALRGSRGALVEANLDGKPLATLERPAEIVVRLVDAIAPVVQQIASHSLSPHELVLKRLLGGDRREEIFLSRAELVQKLEPLSPDLRRVFAPLGLVEDAAPATPPYSVSRRTSATRPPPVEPAPVRADTEKLDPTPSVVVAPEPTMPTAAAPPPPPPPPLPAVTIEAPLSPEIHIEVTPPPITLEAELPPRAVGALGTLPTLPGSRPGRRTNPPPPPRPPAPATGPTNASIDAALRDLEDSEPTEVLSGHPRPPGEPR